MNKIACALTGCFLLPLQALWASDVTSEEAARAAAVWLSRSGVARDGRVADVRTYADAAGRGRFHAVRLKGKGFVITSADRRIRPILAESDGGSFSGDPNSPLYAMLMADTVLAEKVSLSASTASSGASRPAQSAASFRTALSDEERAWAELLGDASRTRTALQNATASEQKGTASSLHDFVIRAPFVETRWNQTTHNNYHEENWVYAGGTGKLCYNLFTPFVTDTYGTCVGKDGEWEELYVTDEDSSYVHTRRASCGCTATAGAQVMFKFRHPARFDYGKMARKPKICGGDASYAAIGKLTFAIGEACEADWAKDASEGTSISLDTLIAKMRSSFDYAAACYVALAKDYDRDRFDSLVVPNLVAGKPVLLSIVQDGKNVGHCVVVDGVRVRGGVFSYHVNMGWGGSDDAWCTMPNVERYDVVRGVGVNIDPAEKKGLLTVLVTDDDGSPVRGATVSLNGEAQSQLTDARGILSGSGTGTFTVSVAKGELTSDTRTVQLACDGAGSVENALLVFALSGRTRIETPQLVVSHPANSGNALISAAASMQAYEKKYGAGKVSVRLTFDGSLPTESDLELSGLCARSGSGAVVVKARAFCEGYAGSEVFETEIDFPVVANGGTLGEVCEVAGESGELTLDNAAAVVETDEPSHSPVGKAGGASVWAKFTAPSTGDYTFRASGYRSDESSLDTQLAVYRPPAAGTAVSLRTLVRVAANDDVDAGSYDLSSRVAFSAAAGETYYIATDVADGERGKIELSWEPGRNDAVEPESAAVDFNPAAETRSVKVRSTASWSVVSQPDWVDVEKLSGEDGESLTFTVRTLEEGSESRSGAILISAGGGDNSSVRVSQSATTWYRTKAEAVAAAKRLGRRILLVSGRDSCGNTSYLRLTACESARVRGRLSSDYVLWYSDCDRDYAETRAYSQGLGGYELPLVCILDPDEMDTPVARSTGYLSIDQLSQILEDNVERELPTQVGGLEATGDGDARSVVLTWNRARHGMSYEVWRGTAWDPAKAVLLADEVTLESYRDDTAAADTLYWYRVRAVNPRGHGSFSKPVSGCWRSSDTTGDPLIGVALGAPQLDWTTDADNPWVMQSNTVWSGNAALQSGAVTSSASSQTSVLRTRVTGPVRMDFRYLACQYWYGKFEVTVDGTAVFTVGDIDTGWSQATVEIPAGTHDVAFVFRKFYASAYDEPTYVCLDDVLFDVASSAPSFTVPTSETDTTAHAFSGEMYVGFVVPDGGVVHYTTDATEPTESSPVYDRPFRITQTSLVKALCVQPGHDVSPTISGLYLERHPVAPGEWTRDIADVKTAGLTNGNLIVALLANFDTCSYSKSFWAVATNAAFLAWAKVNGVYLVSGDESLHLGVQSAQSHFWKVCRDAGAEDSVWYPSLAVSSAWLPDKAVGFALARKGETIGGVTYAGDVDTLKRGLAAYLSKRPTNVRTSVVFNEYAWPNAISTNVYVAGRAFGTLPTPTRSDRVFVGWCTSYSTEYGDIVTASTVVPYSGLTLYGQWKACGLIRFAAGAGASGSIPEMACSEDRVYSLPPCTFTPPSGKRFAGWQCSNGRRYDDGMLIYNFPAPGIVVTMTALWE